MAKVFTLAKREFTSLFFSLIGYVVIAVYLGWLGVIFALLVFIPGQVGDTRWMFTFSHWILFIVIPLMTMAAFADEYASGRIEMLRTSPITEGQIVFGKYLGVLAFFGLLLVGSLFFVGMLMVFGRPNYGTVAASYLGVFLVGMLSVAIGLFFSSVTRHQIVAALLGIFVLFLLTIGFDIVTSFFKAGRIPTSNAFLRDTRDVIGYLSFGPHLESFAKGVVETRHLAYFGTGTFLFLLLTYLVLESRKWR